MRQRFRNKRRRVERQEEATERQARYGALSPMSRMLLMDDRPGNKAREWVRIKNLAALQEPAIIGAVRLA